MPLSYSRFKAEMPPQTGARRRFFPLIFSYLSMPAGESFRPWGDAFTRARKAITNRTPGYAMSGNRLWYTPQSIRRAQASEFWRSPAQASASPATGRKPPASESRDQDHCRRTCQVGEPSRGKWQTPLQGFDEAADA